MQCSNTNGSYTCRCNQGFIGSGVTCSDLNECSNRTLNKCDPTARCFNRYGTYKCKCKSGFFGNGFKCTPDGDVMAAPMQCSTDGE